MVEEFQHLVEGVNFTMQEDDEWLWLEDSSYKITMRSTYMALYNLRMRSQEVDIFKCLWHLKIPPKVAFLVWRVLYDRLPTKNNLYKRKIRLNNNDYAFTFCLEEHVSNLFFTCKFTYRIWRRWYNLLGFSSTLPKNAAGHFWQTSHGERGHKANH